MARLPIMPLLTDAIIADTTHLSAEEFGAYVLILLAMWRNNGKPLRADDSAALARVARVGSNRWRTKLEPKLMPFFDISEGYLHQKRLEIVWESTLKFSEIQRAKGVSSGDARREVKRLKNNDVTTNPVEPRFASGSNNQNQIYRKSLKTHEEGKWKRASTVAPEPASRAIATPHREPVINGYNPNNARSPGESEWRGRLTSFRDSRFWLGDWGPPPTDARCWLLVSPADIPYQHLLIEFGFAGEIA